ncbi:MAG: hypothetical protein R3277_13795 [Brumimicrobium sp.]|nr:hypothetical protein [Brumimicrobium sp.]
MKSYRKLFLMGATAFCLVMNSCEDEKNDAGSDEGKKKVDKELLDPNRSFNTTFDGKLFSVPSPVQTALLIKSLNIPFNETLLNPKSNIGNYSDMNDKALNLGVYGADLGYVTLYDQNAKAIDYLGTVESLANDLGISGAFDKTFLERFEANSNNEDSMLVILTDAFRKGDNFLKENDRKNISALILTGGWLESMFFAGKLYKESNEKKILMRLGQQKQSLETLIELLEKYNEGGTNDKVLNHLKSLNDSFQKIKVTYEYVEPKTVSEEKLTIIKSKMNVEMPDELANEIIQKISEIRNSVIDPTKKLKA